MTFLRLICLVSLFFILCNCSTAHMSPTDKISGKILAQFSKQMKKKGLYAVGLGGGEKGGRINLVSIAFDTHQVMDIESARRLIVESSNALLMLINSNDAYADYFIQNPVPVKLIRISIFGKRTTEKPCNYVEIASLSRGVIDYKIDNIEPRFPPLTTIHEETFEEAVQILAEQKTCSDDMKNQAPQE